ncbi:MAG: glycosyltransferase family 2 protein [Promethearchaeota archaeon]
MKFTKRNYKIENKLVSVITPTHNRANIIKEAMNSVLNQTYKNFEYIIVDNGSTDNTEEIVRSFKDERIKYIWQENSGSPAGSRNTGMMAATGYYIAFCDSDDLWLPQKLEKQIEIFEKYDDILLVATNVISFIQKFDLNKNHLSLSKNKRITFKNILKRNNIYISSVLMKRIVFDDLGLMDEDPRLWAEDYDYWLRLLKYKNKSVLILKEALTKFRFSETSSSYKISFLEYCKKMESVLNKHGIYNQKYLKRREREEIFKLKYNKMKKFLLQKSLFCLLKEENIIFKDKLSCLISYYYNKFNKNLYRINIKLLNILKIFLKFIYNQYYVNFFFKKINMKFEIL